jgi:hypothetical protein
MLATGKTGFKALLICARFQRRAKELRMISANGAGMRLICASVAVSPFRWVKAWKRVVPIAATSSPWPAADRCRQSLRNFTVSWVASTLAASTRPCDIPF